MNINPIITAYGSQIQGTQESQKSAKGETRKPVPPKKESVEFSDTSKNMQSVRDAANKAPDVRVELVVEIKRKIKDGSYDLNSSVSAAIDRMIKSQILA